MFAVSAAASRYSRVAAAFATFGVVVPVWAWVSGDASRTEWSVSRRVRDTPPAFILDDGAGGGTFVPKRVLSSSDADALRSLARAAATLDASPSWRMPAIGAAIGAVPVVLACALFAAGILGFGPSPA